MLQPVGRVCTRTLVEACEDVASEVVGKPIWMRTLNLYKVFFHQEFVGMFAIVDKFKPAQASFVLVANNVHKLEAKKCNETK